MKTNGPICHKDRPHDPNCRGPLRCVGKAPRTVPSSFLWLNYFELFVYKNGKFLFSCCVKCPSFDEILVLKPHKTKPVKPLQLLNVADIRAKGLAGTNLVPAPGEFTLLSLALRRNRA